VPCSTCVALLRSERNFLKFLHDVEDALFSPFPGLLLSSVAPTLPLRLVPCERRGKEGREGGVERERGEGGREEGEERDTEQIPGGVRDTEQTQNTTNHKEIREILIDE